MPWLPVVADVPYLPVVVAARSSVVDCQKNAVVSPEFEKDGETRLDSEDSTMAPPSVPETVLRIELGTSLSFASLTKLSIRESAIRKKDLSYIV